jgi:hypothetical protein
MTNTTLSHSVPTLPAPEVFWLHERDGSESFATTDPATRDEIMAYGDYALDPYHKAEAWLTPCGNTLLAVFRTVYGTTDLFVQVYATTWSNQPGMIPEHWSKRCREVYAGWYDDDQRPAHRTRAEAADAFARRLARWVDHHIHHN